MRTNKNSLSCVFEALHRSCIQLGRSRDTCFFYFIKLNINVELFNVLDEKNCANIRERFSFHSLISTNIIYYYYLRCHHSKFEALIQKQAVGLMYQKCFIGWASVRLYSHTMDVEKWKQALLYRQSFKFKIFLTSFT